MGDDSRDFLIIYVSKLGRNDLRYYGYASLKTGTMICMKLIRAI
jgi:hypothetical protein